MGYAEFNSSMESRTGSVSSGLECSSGVRRQTLKTSPFCPHPSSKLTQSIVKDHMVSHYKKIYSAKASIDTSVPKSLLQSVKYNDQIRKEQQRKGVRPHSAFSSSRRNNTTSCFSAQQYDESPYVSSRSSIVSTPRLNSSFNAKDVVYPSCSVNSHYTRPSSERRYRSPDAAFKRKRSTCSLAASRDQGFYKTFQDPVKKTYSGDLLEKHSQHFTQEKPFTPKTLKSDKSSYLSKYRFYRAPQIKSSQEDRNSRLLGGETVCKSTNHKEHSEKLDNQSQEYSSDHDWSEDEVPGTYLSPLPPQKHKMTSQDHYLFRSSSRVSPEGGKSPIRSLIFAEEEELLYLEFISAVTEDILSRGHISDRMLERVMNRHIDMNRHHLDEGKMRHLLEVLRNEFEEPSNIFTSSKDPLKNGKAFLDSIFSHLESESKPVKTKEDKDIITDASLIHQWDLPDCGDLPRVSTPSYSAVRTAPSTNKSKEDEKGENYEEAVGLTMCGDDVTESTIASQEDFHRTDITVNVHDKNHEHTSVISDVSREPSKEVEDLGNILSELLHVSSNTDSENVAPTEEGHTNQHDDVSDDDF
ncbi:spermatogenesis-associated protein 7 homolog isoform X1 [Fundulus heteroclitus]|uniref:spermatogenesis-associated protein 7 homolog isoform X1 n=1 Tax=Fundulus heteroclitus TaxID=8078 RepID=UPI00165B22EB|nr:spermatogenesis-associated protein 7 homolog isoform X1 [Fundulus heteroclitus]